MSKQNIFTCLWLSTCSFSLVFRLSSFYCCVVVVYHLVGVVFLFIIFVIVVFHFSRIFYAIVRIFVFYFLLVCGWFRSFVFAASRTHTNTWTSLAQPAHTFHSTICAYQNGFVACIFFFNFFVAFIASSCICSCTNGMIKFGTQLCN